MVIGLGNPGKAYHGTRHNVGFAVVDEIAHRQGLRFRLEPSGLFRYAECRIETGALALIKPESYINNSQAVITPLSRRYAALWGRHTLLIVCDTLDLPVGKLRLKSRGGSAGHGGLKSLILRMGNDFPRLYIGIGRPPSRHEVKHYVLSRPPQQERAIYSEMIQQAAEIICSYPQVIKSVSHATLH